MDLGFSFPLQLQMLVDYLHSLGTLLAIQIPFRHYISLLALQFQELLVSLEQSWVVLTVFTVEWKLFKVLVAPHFLLLSI